MRESRSVLFILSNRCHTYLNRILFSYRVPGWNMIFCSVLSLLLSVNALVLKVYILIRALNWVRQYLFITPAVNFLLKPPSMWSCRSLEKACEFVQDQVKHVQNCASPGNHDCSNCCLCLKVYAATASMYWFTGVATTKLTTGEVVIYILWLLLHKLCKCSGFPVRAKSSYHRFHIRFRPLSWDVQQKVHQTYK